MELQSFINNHLDDYINIFKEYKLYVRKYSQLGLLLVKMKWGSNYDLTNNPWMKYCRGVIIDINKHEVICVPPIKSEQKFDVNINNYGDEYTYEPLIDGTMINLFYHKDDWIISTRSNIGAKNSWDGKIPFNKLFYDVNGEEWIQKLKKDHSYSFVLQHKESRIVSPIDINSIYLVEMYKRENGVLIKVPTNELDIIENINTIFSINQSDIECYFNNTLYFSIKGFTIKKADERIKWINPNYEYVNNLKANYNHKFLNYVKLRREWKLSEYLKYFPEEQGIFNEYRDNYSSIKNKLYKSYVDLHITKSISLKEILYPFKPLVYEIHGHYMKTKHKINMEYINDYMLNIPDKRLLFIYNWLF